MQFLYSHLKAWELRDTAVVSVVSFIVVAGYVVSTRVDLPSVMSTGARPAKAAAFAGLEIGEPIVSFNFDSGYSSAYVNALPLFEQAGFPTTQYIIPARLGELGYINEAQVRKMHKDGHEIGVAGRTHARLTGLSDSKLLSEIVGARDDIEALGIPVFTFAYPYGSLDRAAKEAVADAGFIGARGLEDDANSERADRYTLNALWVRSDTIFDEVRAAIDEALEKKEWLIIVFSRVDEPKTHDGENVSHEFVARIIDYVQGTGIRVATNAEVLEQFSP